MIRYQESLDGIDEGMLTGFFEGWPNPPNEAAHMRILRGSDYVVLAIDDSCRRVVGFVNAISDGTLCALIPLLEVLPDYRGQGIGREVMHRMLRRLGDLYSVDLVCDEDMTGFYEALGMKPYRAMIVRRFEHQAGRPA